MFLTHTLSPGNFMAQKLHVGSNHCSTEDLADHPSADVLNLDGPALKNFSRNS